MLQLKLLQPTMKVAVLLTVLAAASIPAEGTSKLLPAVRASLSLGSTLLRHLAQIKDRLREDVERHLLRNVEHAYPVQIFKLPMWQKSVLARPWVSPQFHSSFSYQAAGSGGLPVLPFPFFPPPMRPAMVLVPCGHPRTHIAQFILPCIRVIGTGAGLGAPQISVVQGAGNETTHVTATGLGAPQLSVVQGTGNETTDVTAIGLGAPQISVVQGTGNEATDVTAIGLGAPQISIVQGTGNKTTNVTTTGLAENDIFPRVRTTTVANEDIEEEVEERVTENSPTVIPSTQTDDVTDTGATTWSVQSTTFAVGAAETTTADSATSHPNTPVTDFAATSTSEEDTPVTDAGTTIDGAATTEAPHQSSATLPEDRQANTIPDSTRQPTTTLSATKETSEQGFPTVDATDSEDFNEVLKGAQVSFGKLVYE